MLTQPSGASRRLPGPAGSLTKENSVSGPVAASQSSTAAFHRMHASVSRSFFQRTSSWVKLEQMVSHTGEGIDVPGRMTLARVLSEASSHPTKPLRVVMICALIKSIGNQENSGDDVPVTLVDESGEMEGTMHGRVRSFLRPCLIAQLPASTFWISCLQFRSSMNILACLWLGRQYCSKMLPCSV